MPVRYAIRPRTMMSLVIERIAAETGHSEIQIIRHTVDHRRSALLLFCRSFMFQLGEWSNMETGECGLNPALSGESWYRFRDYLIADIGDACSGERS